MITVWKIALEVQDEATIEVPAGAEFLCLQLQDERSPCVWMRVNTARALVPRVFRWCCTGQEAPLTSDYIGTIQVGPLVFHLFVDHQRAGEA